MMLLCAGAEVHRKGRTTLKVRRGSTSGDAVEQMDLHERFEMFMSMMELASWAAGLLFEVRQVLWTLICDLENMKVCSACGARRYHCTRQTDYLCYALGVAYALLGDRESALCVCVCVCSLSAPCATDFSCSCVPRCGPRLHLVLGGTSYDKLLLTQLPIRNFVG